MTDLDCYVEAVATGTVLGIDAHWSPAQVDALLGGEGWHGLNTSTHDWWRDYGLVEIFWGRASLAHHWRGHHFSMQLHRLPHEECRPNEMLLARYGEFRAHTRFSDLQAALAERDIPLVEVPYPFEDYRQFRQPHSGTSLLVVNEHRDPGAEYPDLDFGEVYQISSSDGARALDSTRWQAFGETFAPVPALSADERAAWLSTHEPAGSSQSAWWNALFSHLTLDSRMGGPATAEAAALAEWFFRQALDRPAPVIAAALSWLAELPETLPAGSPLPHITAEEIARTALAVAPLTPGQTRWADPEVRGPDLPAQLLTRSLIATAAGQRRHLKDADLREQLLPWLALWPELR